MKRFVCLVGLITILMGCVSVVAPGPNRVSMHTIRGDSSYCYGLAMVGMDSVINSRLGIRPEYLLHLALVDPEATITLPEHLYIPDRYSPLLLKIIYEAYLWEGSPHEYASEVMYTCAL
jgi:hypothetical protein